MNWFKKIASVTFSISDSHKIAQPMDLMNIASDLVEFVFFVKGLKGLNIRYDHIVPDMSSSDISAPKGIINFYLSDPRLTLDFVKMLVNDYNKHKDPHIALEVLKEEKSGIMKYNVVRINVVKNDTIEFEHLPEFNIANSNAIALLTLLSHYGMPVKDESVGDLDVDILEQVLNRIDAIDYDVLDSYTQDLEESIGEHGAISIDLGRSKEQLERYLSSLKSMVSYIRQSNMPNAEIQYG